MTADDWRRVDRNTWLVALRDPRLPLTTTDVAVLSSLATWMDRYGDDARPGNVKLAAAARVDPGTVTRALTKARKLRLLRCTYRGHRKGDGTTHASIWAASLPVDICQPVDVSTAHPCAIDDSLSRTGPVSIAHQCATTHPLTPIPSETTSSAHGCAEENRERGKWRETLARAVPPQPRRAMGE